MTALTDLLAGWLPRQRWYGSKGRPVEGLREVARTPLSDLLQHVLVEVSFTDGPAETYQVPLVIRRDAPFGHDAFLVGEIDEGLVYDGLHDPAGSATLLSLIRDSADVGGLSFRPLAELPDAAGQALSTEQSNTSVVYGDSAILKVFRRVAPGENPDLEVTRALAGAGSRHIAAPLGWIEGQLDGVTTTFALLQEFLRSGTEGWRLATASVRDLYAEADLHPDEVGGDFAAESERLGSVTAEVHALMARTLPARTADPGEAKATAAQMTERLDAAVVAAPDLAPYAEALRAAYAEVAGVTEPVPVQRIHGDYHLGQVLRVDSGWVLFDFEGEPARPLAERTALMSPLRDVAGMLRSFDYAARSLLVDWRGDTSGEHGLEYRAQEWSDRNRDAFCEGYAAATGRDPRADQVLLRAFELDKAVYEVVYEARHRPAWIAIPLAAVDRLTRAT